MRAVLFAACLMLLSGCTGEANESDTPTQTCDAGVVHPYEQRCAADGEGGEVCHVWIGEGVQRDDYIFCTVQSDGRATVQVVFDGVGKLELNMVQDGAVQWTRTVSPGEYALPVLGDSGDMRLTVGFADATGPVDAWLWG